MTLRVCGAQFSIFINTHHTLSSSESIFYPSLYTHRLQLATLYVQLGMIDDALMVLESDPNASKEDGQQELDIEEEGSLPDPSAEPAKREHRDQVSAMTRRTEQGGNLRFLVCPFTGYSSVDSQVQAAGEQGQAKGVCDSWLRPSRLLPERCLQQAESERYWAIFELGCRCE